MRRAPGPLRSRRIGFAVLCVVALLAGGWLALRDAAFVRVREVAITGTASSEAAAVRAALTRAARGMTTLHVREDVLHAAVADHPSVAGLRVDAHLPRGLDIEVLERVPVAALETDGQRVPATGGGLLLRGLSADPKLPTLSVRTLPAGRRVTDAGTLQALAVAAAAPGRLRGRMARLERGPRGLTLALRSGPELVFGTDSRARAKWIAAARVLAEPSAQGATYLDLRLPTRVAAGGVGPVPAEDLDAQSEVEVG